MADFTDEDKVERGNGQYFDEGIHEVRVGAVEFGETDDNREYAEVTVFDESGEREAKVRFWFHTQGARGYSFGSIRNMIVHNTPEAKKEAVRKKFNAIKNTEELNDAMQKILVADAGQVWLQVYQDGTYQKDGQAKPNYRRDLYGYLPPAKKATTTNSQQSSNDSAPAHTDADAPGDSNLPDGF